MTVESFPLAEGEREGSFYSAEEVACCCQPGQRGFCPRGKDVGQRPVVKQGVMPDRGMGYICLNLAP